MEILKKILKEEYLIQSNNIKKSVESTDNNVYISDNKYVIKIYRSMRHTNSMVELHTFLYNNGFNVPEIIKTKDNNTYVELSNDEYIVVYSFLEGTAVQNIWDERNKFIKDIAKEIRKFHDKTQGDNIFNLKEAPIEIELNSSRKSVLHFDLTKVNIFYHDNIGFIDFDDAKYGYSIIDLAITLSLLFTSKSRGLEKEEMMEFIDAYYGETIKLKNQEIKYLKEIMLKWVNLIISNNNFDSSTKESFDVKKELIEKEFDL